MYMKEHILAALREEFDQWEAFLAGMDDEHLSTPLHPSSWTIKDVVAHLRTWQQRTFARMEAASLDREPEFPVWSAGADPDTESSLASINDWIYETYRHQPWTEVHRNWREGFLRFLETASRISERDFLDSDRYPWLNGNSLALYLLGSYDHHQEHFEMVQRGLRER